MITALQKALHKKTLTSDVKYGINLTGANKHIFFRNMKMIFLKINDSYVLTIGSYFISITLLHTC